MLRGTSLSLLKASPTTCCFPRPASRFPPLKAACCDACRLPLQKFPLPLHLAIFLSASPYFRASPRFPGGSCEGAVAARAEPTLK
ncbi:hypothetical protein CLOM_g1964 [Closterium sp. NIES-68]|nr:hypothetical protein CLOM_g1964 [Closterium sp. NIES-68]